MKLKELGKKEHDASMSRFKAGKEVEFAEEGYKAARSDGLGETVERAAMIRMAQEEVRSARTQFEQARESTERTEFKGQVLGALGSIPCLKGKMKRHRILLEWIEQQRREIASGRADLKKEGGQGRSKRTSSRVLRNQFAPEASRLNKSSKAYGRRRKQSMTRSILSPVNPAKVSKAPSKQRSPRQKMSVPYDASQAVGKETPDSSAPELTSMQVFKVKDAMPTSLRSIQSSRVSRPRRKRPIRLGTDGTDRLQREDSLRPSLAPSTSGKVMQQSAIASLRRSSRTSKPPERFRPGQVDAAVAKVERGGRMRR